MFKTYNINVTKLDEAKGFIFPASTSEVNFLIIRCVKTGIPFFKKQGHNIQVPGAEEQKTKFLTLRVVKKEG